MKLYVNEYLFEDGHSYVQVFQDKDERDLMFKDHNGSALIRRRDFEEVDLDEE